MKILYALVLITLPLSARMLFTPNVLQKGPLNELYSELKQECWWVNGWAAYYERSAKIAFDNCGQKTPLSTLFFNLPNFSAQQAFAQNMVTVLTNPLVATSILGPRVKYNEKGVMIGADVQGYVSENVRLGFRARLPVKKIRMRRCVSQGNGCSTVPNGVSDLGGQTVSSVALEKNEDIDGANVISYAYRLDFLSRLPYSCDASCPGSNFLIVNYSDTDFPPNNPITISNQDVTNITGTNVSVIASPDGCPPEGQFAITQATAQQLPILDNTGTNIPDSERARFDASVNYTPLGGLPNNQAHLFVVPSVANGQTTAPSRVIQQQVRELITCIAPEAETVFTDCGISFASQCRKGVGDFDTDFFAGYFFSQCFYGEAIVGIKWPTGKRAKSPSLVFQQPLGNNGHYEYKLEVDAFWQPSDWFNLKTDLAWNSVQGTLECVASSFIEACVKNIGVPTAAAIFWDYFVFDVDLLITPSWKKWWACGLGADVGYELYHKSKDTINFKATEINDCVGNNQLLDSSVLTRNTNVLSHKIRAEAFLEPSWARRHPFVLYGGGSVVIAGKNAPKESEWYVGATLFF